MHGASGVDTEPRNANGAMSAPVLTPVTTSYCGRSWRRLSPTKAPAPNAPPAPPPERTRARSVPSFDEALNRCRAVVDFASTLARSVLKNRTPAGKSTGAAVLNIVGGASRRGRAHPPSAKTLSTHVQRRGLAWQQWWSLLRVVSMLRFLRGQLQNQCPTEAGSTVRAALGASTIAIEAATKTTAITIISPLVASIRLWLVTRLLNISRTIDRK